MKHFIIGTAGHIDHGKTSLIKALTHFDCDTHPEEKKRGITINLGFTHLTLPDGSIAGIIDVPGHKDFIHTMISGASGIDLLLLVIASDSGIMPQTLEHLEIANLLGIQKAVVALTKADKVDEEWLELLEDEIREALKSSLFPDCPIVPVSALTGAGLSQLSLILSEQKDTLISKPAQGPFRLYIDRVFNPKGQGFVITGSVLSGKIQTGQMVYMLPGEKEFTIRSMQRFGLEVNEVQAGDRAAISLPGFKQDEFERGMLLMDRKAEVSLYLDARLSLSNSVAKIPVKNTILFLSGTYQTQARLNLISTKELLAGESAVVQIIPEFPGILSNGDHFIIRNSSGDQTLGGGIIIDNQALHHKRIHPKLIESLLALEQSYQQKEHDTARIIHFIQKTGKPIELNQLTQEFPGCEPILKSYCQEHPEDILMDFTGNLFIPNPWISKLSGIIQEELRIYHQKNYLKTNGLTINELAGKCNIKLKTVEYQSLIVVLQLLAQQHQLKQIDNTWCLYNHQIILQRKDEEQLNWLKDLFLSYQLNKPVPEEFEQQANMHQINKEKLYMLLNYLVKTGEIYHFEGDYLHADIVDKSRKTLLWALKEKGKGINEGDFRVLINGTKKIIHPLIGIFCREGVVKQDIYIINITELGLKSLN